MMYKIYAIDSISDTKQSKVGFCCKNFPRWERMIHKMEIRAFFVERHAIYYYSLIYNMRTVTDLFINLFIYLFIYLFQFFKF